MFVEAQRVSKMQDNETLCHPTKGYNAKTHIELDQYEEIGISDEELSENNCDWPKGSPLLEYIKFENKILKKKPIL